MPLSYQHFRKLLLLDDEAGPLEEELPRLADEGLNHRVAEDLNLQLPNVSIPWTHKVGNFTGLYSSTLPIFNPNWQTPSFPDIHLHQDIINKCEQFVGPLTVNERRRLKLVMPARFYPTSTKYLPLEKGIKPYYPQDVVNHYFQTRHYLHTLWEAGILYKRETTRSASFCGSPYSWEQELQHGAESFNQQSTRIFSRAPVGPCIQSKHQQSRLGLQPQQGQLAKGQRGRSGSVRSRAHSATRRSVGVEPSGSGHNNNSASESASCLHQSAVRQEAYSHFSTSERHSSSGHALELHDISPSSARSQSKGSVFSCWWLQFRNSIPCSGHCLSHLVNLLEDWGPCTEHGKHHIRIPRTPARVTGGVFLVDKNPHNTAESRLVVDFSQFSRGSTRVPWPKFAVPNLQSLTNLLSSNLSWLSLDVSAAFYHLPLHPAAMPHLLVGSSGLSRYVARLSSNSRIHDHQHGTMQNLHNYCTRNLFVSLMLLYKTFGRKLHLYSHPIVLGFRKIPMGVGLSPFLLAQFTSAICSVVRRAFPHCLAFSYMDDVVLGAKSVQHLESLYTAVTNFLLSLGIHLNPTKTKRWGYSLNFMGYVIGSWGTLPQEHIVQKIKHCFRKIPVNRPIDWKVCQRIVGLLGFAAPFTQCGYPALMPLYACIQAKQAFTFSPIYKAFLSKQYATLYPVARQRAGLCQVFADATPTGWGLVIGQQRMRGTFVAPLPIHTAELLAACFARSRSGANIIGTDNSVVLSRKYTSFPWLLGCAANWILRGTSFVYVPSALNPADDPSRGRLGLSRPLCRLPFQPTTGRTSLYAVSPSVPSHLPDRVHFASPLHVAWRPP
ncbi:DNA polymerase [Hepatitis B virus]|uniref:Protein P n=1 Tax=Gorilla hepatitis B virus (isolate Cameroon/gor97) TaxID=489546 RepID=DPOL_HBVGO|nr:RecName: Full=Protein P; Includes: RecName: Full=DNA-directed DNA polymerase; Includes: RecName: Full=RNA-directed DNA polymerase; Includes: RecName: Full=Ribonuclease H [Hepatitis B virus gorilla/Cameroon/gor97]CAA10422.1 DNA polymerase [Hepatitis B virus]